jgi:hypothetical protein
VATIAEKYKPNVKKATAIAYKPIKVKTEVVIVKNPVFFLKP